MIQLAGFKISEEYIHLQTIRAIQDRAQTAADQIENFISKIELDHLGIAQEFQITRPENEDYLYKSINFILKQNKFYERLSILTLNGKELVKVDRNGAYPADKLNYEIPSEAFNLAKSGKLGISKVYFPENDPFPHMDMFTPIISDKGGIAGVIKGQLNLNSLWDIIAKTTIGKTGFAYVVDEDGRLIAHPNNILVKTAPVLTNRPIVSKMVVQHNELHNQAETYLDENNNDVVAAGVRVAEVSWAVIVQQPVSEAYIQITTLRNMILVTVVGSFFLLIVLAIIISNGITKPIQTLIEFTKRIKQGDYSVDVQVNSGDEIEILSVSLNTMTEQLHRLVTELNHKLREMRIQKQSLNESTQMLLKSESEIRKINQELKDEKVTISAERNKLAIILSGVQDAVIATNLDHRIVLFNLAAEIMTGYQTSEVIDKHLDEVIKLVNKDGQLKPETYAPIRDDDFEGVIFEHKDLSLIDRSGSKIAVNLISGKIKESRSSELGSILTFHDISKEQKLEEMKIDFVSMAAHELRTPVTVIRGYTDTLQEEVTQVLNPSQNEYINRISIGVKALGDLIDNLLNVSRIEQNKFKVELLPSNLADVINSTFNSFQTIAHTRDQHIILNIHQDLPIVMADKIRIAQVISNLLANATTYTQTGGTITLTAKGINYSDRSPQEYLMISVSDTGQGIPKEALPNLFTKFFRVSGTLEQGSKGTGLGLFISKSIINFHHGDIWAESELGKGATFSFIIPVATEEEIKKTSLNSNEPKHGIILNERKYGLNNQ
jgi:PAS domain S-box-containing protein